MWTKDLCSCISLVRVQYYWVFMTGKYSYLYYFSRLNTQNCHPAEWPMLENEAQAVLQNVWEHAPPAITFSVAQRVGTSTREKEWSWFLERQRHSVWLHGNPDWYMHTNQQVPCPLEAEGWGCSQHARLGSTRFYPQVQQRFIDLPQPHNLPMP